MRLATPLTKRSLSRLASADGKRSDIRSSLGRHSGGVSALSRSVDRHVHLYVDGAYELRLLQIIERLFQEKPGAVMLDVGSNIGNHAVFLSRSFGRIVCFESSPFIAERLKKTSL